MNHRAYGRLAEEDAVRFLESLGFVILATNFHSRMGELDIVAMEQGTLCFVEVKARRARGLVSALEAVGWRKQQRIAMAAQKWLVEHPHEGDVRFDVVYRDTEHEPWQLLRDAFRAESA